MPPAAAFDSTALIAVGSALAAGRALLSLLPAGRPGGHGPAEWAATASASWLLGAHACALALRYGVDAVLGGWLFAGVVGAGWLVYGTGAMVPRYAPGPRTRSWVERALWLAALALLAAAYWRTSQPWMVPHALAGLTLFAYGLRWSTPRSAALGGTLAAGAAAAIGGLALALPAASFDEVLGWSGAAPALVGAVVGASAWLARGERRGLWLAALLAGASGSVLGGAALGLALVARTAAPARRRLPAPLVVGLAVGVASSIPRPQLDRDAWIALAAPLVTAIWLSAGRGQR